MKLGTTQAIVKPRMRSVRVEDANHAAIEAKRAPILHSERFAEPLTLVVTAAWPIRTDVSPVALRLRVYQRVAINLRGRGKEKASTILRASSSRFQVPWLLTRKVSRGSRK